MLFTSKVLGVHGMNPDPERKKDLQAFEKVIEVRFRNIAFLNLAFCHRSCGNEASHSLGSNERLEFLGDSVLGMVIADYLFQTLYDKPEGELAKIKSYVVSENSLSEIALELGVQRYLLIGKGEEMSGGREKKAILADALEAIIGAIYLDQGIKVARDFVLRFLVEQVQKVLLNKHKKDYKTLLQEFTQKHLRVIPRYTCVDKTGPDHAKVFTYMVYVGTSEFGPAQGHSKKEAEQGAAQLAWQKLAQSQEFSH